MAKGSGGEGGEKNAGGVGGRSAGERPRDIVARQAIAVLERGIQDSRLDYLRTGMRELETHRAYFKGRDPNAVTTSPKYPPIRIAVEIGKSGKLSYFLRDGRHRLATARAFRATRIRAEITVYGPRGGIVRETTTIIQIPRR